MDEIDDFWSWFTATADFLARSGNDPALCHEMDIRVARLGEFVWRMGPGVDAENALTISPGGDVVLMPKTEAIVARAPLTPGWAFIAALELEDI